LLKQTKIIVNVRIINKTCEKELVVSIGMRLIYLKVLENKGWKEKDVE
jgi:hypothetical protein